MGQLINLRMARKAKKREEAQTQAATNRALHGRTKRQKLTDAQDKARAEQLLDGARRDPGGTR